MYFFFTKIRQAYNKRRMNISPFIDYYFSLFFLDYSLAFFIILLWNNKDLSIDFCLAIVLY